MVHFTHCIGKAHKNKRVLNFSSTAGNLGYRHTLQNKNKYFSVQVTTRSLQNKMSTQTEETPASKWLINWDTLDASLSLMISKYEKLTLTMSNPGQRRIITLQSDQNYSSYITQNLGNFHKKHHHHWKMLNVQNILLSIFTPVNCLPENSPNKGPKLVS